jgi:hypothetical protein
MQSLILRSPEAITGVRNYTSWGWFDSPLRRDKISPLFVCVFLPNFRSLWGLIGSLQISKLPSMPSVDACSVGVYEDTDSNGL